MALVGLGLGAGCCRKRLFPQAQSYSFEENVNARSGAVTKYPERHCVLGFKDDELEQEYLQYLASRLKSRSVLTFVFLLCWQYGTQIFQFILLYVV